MTPFDSVIGHDEIKARLRQQAETGRVLHAYLFCGKKGIGKCTTATAFAQLLTEGSRPDITFVTKETYPPANKTKTDILPVDSVRAARADMFVRPFLADKRVFIFPHADTMNSEAYNALLKVLEEPPAYCVIILIAQKESLLPQTIRSRVVPVRFSPLPHSLIAQYLADHQFSLSPIALELAAGSIGRAMELAQEDLDEKLRQMVQLTQQLARPEGEHAYRLIAFMEKEKAIAPLLFETLLLLFRNTLLKNIDKHDTIQLKNVSERCAAAAIELVERQNKALAFQGNYGVVVSELILEIREAIHG